MGRSFKKKFKNKYGKEILKYGLSILHCINFIYVRKSLENNRSIFIKRKTVPIYVKCKLNLFTCLHENKLSYDSNSLKWKQWNKYIEKFYEFELYNNLFSYESNDNDAIFKCHFLENFQPPVRAI